MTVLLTMRIKQAGRPFYLSGAGGAASDDTRIVEIRLELRS